MSGTRTMMRATIAAAMVVTTVTAGVVAGPSPVTAAGPVMVGGGCSIYDAVRAVNTAATTNGCVYTGVNVIDISGSTASRFPLLTYPGVVLGGNQGPEIAHSPTALPAIETDITIQGGPGGAGLFSAQADPATSRRLAYVAPTGSLTLRDVSVVGFRLVGAISFQSGIFAIPARDAVGGAIYADGPLALERTAMIGNHATGGNGAADANWLTSVAVRSGAAGIGGAVYAATSLTVTDSVFSGNSVAGGRGAQGPRFIGTGFVESPDSGHGGDARGADIAVGLNGNATITGSVFQGSSAVAGDGAWGHTFQSVKDLIPRPAAPDGREGTCDDTPTVFEASGGDGGNGELGRPAGAGGDGGDAVGVIDGGKEVRLTDVAIVDVTATAGGAGEMGIPGIGGGGGGGGDAQTCYVSIYTVIVGVPGDAGDAGDNGLAAESGARGNAVATVATGVVRMFNTTISGAHAEVRPDNVDPDFPNRATARQNALLRNTNGKQPGCLWEGPDRTLTCGSTGSPGAAAAKISEFEQSAGPGSAQLIGLAADQKADAVFTTMFDGTLAAPPQGLRTNPTATRTLYGYGNIKNSVMQSFGPASPACNMVAGGYNVLIGSCVPAGATDVITGTFPPIRPTLTESGPVLLTDVFGRRWKMLTHRPNTVGTASPVDRQPSGSCEYEGTTLTTDARGGGRDDRCDSGAHELHLVHAAVDTLIGTPTIAPLYGPTGATAGYVLSDIQFADLGASLTVTFGNLEGQVDWGAGWTTETSHTYPIGVTTDPISRAVFIQLAPTADLGPVTMTVSLDPGTGDPDASSTLQASTSADVLYDPALTVDMGVSGDVGRCGTGTMSFTARATGQSEVPPVSATILAMVGGAGATAAVTPWDIPALTSRFDTAQRDLVIDGAQFPNGSVLRPRADYAEPIGGPVIQHFDPFSGTTMTILPDTTLDVALWDAAAGAPVGDLVVGESREIGIDVVNTLTGDCRDVSGVTMSTTVDGNPFAGGAIATESGGWLYGGASDRTTATFVAPDVAGQVTFRTELDMPGLDAPLVFTKAVDVIEDIGPPPSSVPTTTTPAPTTTSLPEPPPPPPPPTPTPTTTTTTTTTTTSTTTTTVPGTVPPVTAPPAPPQVDGTLDDGVVPGQKTLKIRVPEAVGGKTVFGQLTVAKAKSRGFVTAYACKDGLPKDDKGQISKSDLNFDGDVTPVTSNRLVVAADENGDLCFYTSADAALVVDVSGVSDIGVKQLKNERTDTRDKEGVLAAGQTLKVHVPDAVGGKLVFGQLTAAQAKTRGYVTAYACKSGIPKDDKGQISKSDLNFDGGVNPVTSNRLVVAADADGYVCFYVSEPVALVVDVSGVSQTGLKELANQRTDTRDQKVVLEAGQILKVKVDQAVGAKTVFGQLTVAQAKETGYVTAFACKDGVPKDDKGQVTKSDINFDGKVAAVASNRLTVAADADGYVCFYVSKPVALVIDVNAVSDLASIKALANQRTDTRSL